LRPRIGILVGNHYHPNTETFLMNIGKMLTSHFRMDIITNEIIHERVKLFYDVYRYNDRPNNSHLLAIIKEFCSCYKYAKRYKPDVLFHISMPNIHGLIIGIIGRLFRIKTVVRYPGEILKHFRLTDNYYLKFKYLLFDNVLCFFSFCLADRIIVLGKKLQQDAFSFRMNQQKVIILPQPTDTRVFSRPSNKDFFKEQLGAGTKQVVLFVGRLHPCKGINTLISVVRKVHRSKPNVLFIIIGNGELTGVVKDEVGQNLIYAGRVDNDKIHAYFKAADLLILPLALEGVPNVVLEALASGVPVIGSSAGEIANLSSNICFSEKDYIEYIVNSDSVTIDRLPEEFRWSVLKRNYVDVFSLLMSKRKI